MSEFHRSYESILLCGGLGSRFVNVNETLPKSLVRIGGRELMRYSIDLLDPEYVARMIFAVGYKGDVVRDWVEESITTREIAFSESIGKGILPAVTAATKLTKTRRVVVCNTDEVRLGLDIADVIDVHETFGNLATMVVTRSNKLHRHRTIEIDEKTGLITSTDLKPEKYRQNPSATDLVNTGFLVLEEEAYDYFDPAHSTDWSGIIDPLCDAAILGAYVNPQIVYFNVGTKEEYDEANASLEQYTSQH